MAASFSGREGTWWGTRGLCQSRCGAAVRGTTRLKVGIIEEIANGPAHKNWHTNLSKYQSKKSMDHFDFWFGNIDLTPLYGSRLRPHFSPEIAPNGRSYAQVVKRSLQLEIYCRLD
jgi:hypothetical protein